MEYLTPGVYTQNIASGNSAIDTVSSSTGCLIGIAQSGPVNKPILVSSWSDYVLKFAKGMPSAFISDSYLAHSVQGFFQNGGARLYVIRVAKGSVKASGSQTLVEEQTISLTAKYEGLWGNDLKVSIAVDEDNESAFVVTVKLRSEVVETVPNLSSDSTAKNYFGNTSFEYIDFAPTSTIATTTTEISFQGGLDGTADIDDATYLDALNLLDEFDEIILFGIPAQTSDTMLAGITAYADMNRNRFAVIEPPKNSDVESVRSLRKKVTCERGAMYYPWVEIADPLSNISGKTMACPPTGHVLGTYARVFNEVGVWRAPAGTTAMLKGVVGTERNLRRVETDILNPISVNCIIPKTNFGIVIWGARSLSNNGDFKYVSDVTLNMTIHESIDSGTQWAVFEPHDELLRTRLTASVESFLNNLWSNGGLNGETSDKAYTVVCNASNNPDSTVRQGIVNMEVGYNGKTPAEFVIIKISQNTSTETN